MVLVIMIWKFAVRLRPEIDYLARHGYYCHVGFSAIFIFMYVFHFLPTVFFRQFVVVMVDSM